MTTKQQTMRSTSAVDELRMHCPELEAQRVVDSLSAGFSTLRDLLMVRAHDDVDRTCPADSMEIPSLAKLQRQVRKARLEIEAYSCIVAADEVRSAALVEQSDTWFLDWIFRLRLSEDAREVLLGLADVFADDRGKVNLVHVETQLIGDDPSRHGLSCPRWTGKQYVQSLAQ